MLEKDSFGMLKPDYATPRDAWRLDDLNLNSALGKALPSAGSRPSKEARSKRPKSKKHKKSGGF